MMKRLFTHSVLLLALLGTSASLRAADLVIGVEDLPYMPYYSTDGGEYFGFARELFDRFAAERGHRIQYRPLPVERLYRSLMDGSIDIKFPDNPEWRHDLKLQQQWHYSEAVVPFLDGVMVPNALLTKPADRPLRIGTVRGFTPWPLLPRVEQGSIRMFENNSIAGLLRQSLGGRLDGVYLNVAVADFHLRNFLRADAQLVLDTRLPHDRSAYHASSLHKSEVIKQLNHWLRANRAQLRTLQQKWNIHP